MVWPSRGSCGATDGKPCFELEPGASIQREPFVHMYPGDTARRRALVQAIPRIRGLRGHSREACGDSESPLTYRRQRANRCPLFGLRPLRCEGLRPEFRARLCVLDRAIFERPSKPASSCALAGVAPLLQQAPYSAHTSESSSSNSSAPGVTGGSACRTSLTTCSSDFVIKQSACPARRRT